MKEKYRRIVGTPEYILETLQNEFTDDEFEEAYQHIKAIVTLYHDDMINPRYLYYCEYDTDLRTMVKCGKEIFEYNSDDDNFQEFLPFALLYLIVYAPVLVMLGISLQMCNTLIFFIFMPIWFCCFMYFVKKITN